MQIQALDPDIAAIQASLMRRKIVAGAAARGVEEPFDRRLIEAAIRAVVSGLFGDIGGEAAFGYRQVPAPEISRISEYTCWCAFETENRPIVIAFDDATTRAVAHAALGNPRARAKVEQASGVDRFIAAVFAKRLAVAHAAAAPHVPSITVGKRLAIADAFSALRLDGNEGPLDLFEFSQLTVSTADRLRFLIVGPPLTSKEAAGADQDSTDRAAAVSTRLARHALAAPVKIAARLRFARMAFSEAAALRPGDIIESEYADSAIELVAVSSTAEKPLFEATMGRLEKTRAVQIARPARGDGILAKHVA